MWTCVTIFLRLSKQFFFLLFFFTMPSVRLCDLQFFSFLWTWLVLIVFFLVAWVVVFYGL